MRLGADEAVTPTAGMGGRLLLGPAGRMTDAIES